jgi:hypothetical protein
MCASLALAAFPTNAWRVEIESTEPVLAARLTGAFVLACLTLGLGAAGGALPIGDAKIIHSTTAPRAGHEFTGAVALISDEVRETLRSFKVQCAASVRNIPVPGSAKAFPRTAVPSATVCSWSVPTSARGKFLFARVSTDATPKSSDVPVHRDGIVVRWRVR